METKKERASCPACGQPFVKGSRLGASEIWSVTKRDFYCLNCQERKFNQLLADTDDEYLALYFNCLFFDRPFDSITAKEVMAEPLMEPHWNLYLKKLKDKGLLIVGQKFMSFRSTDTGLDPRLLQEVSNSERYDRRAASNGRWGMKFTDGGTVPYTKDEVSELDRMYTEQASEYKGAMTQRVDMAIREICVCRLEWKKCVGAGDANGAKKYSDMIKDAMTREGLRANDAKPTETMRVDSLIDRLERKGAMTDGSLVSRQQLINILAQDHPQYKTSLDVVDAMMMAIINTMRRNNGQSELDELPFEAQIQDDFNELMGEQTEAEKKTMSEIGMAKPRREGEPWKITEG